MRTNIIAVIILLLCVSVLSPPASARVGRQQPTPKTTIVEQSQALPRPPPGTLGTKAYEPTPQESAFYAKLPNDEKTNGSMFGDYSITGKKGRGVGWFGIVRKIDEDQAANETRLLVEHKYFDGLTDTHILALSFNGGGDYTAVLRGTNLGIKKLSLIRTYGVVQDEKGGVPQVAADYVRQWDWGLFTFLDAYGRQKGNKEWQKLNKANLSRIYNPFPDTRYYEDRLGARDRNQ